MAQVTEGEQRGTADPRPAAMDLFTLGLGPMSLCVSDGWRLERVQVRRSVCTRERAGWQAADAPGSRENCRGWGWADGQECARERAA